MEMPCGFFSIYIRQPSEVDVVCKLLVLAVLARIGMPTVEWTETLTRGIES